MAIENSNLIQKAQRLVEMCRERSRDNRDTAHVWLSHRCIDSGLDDEFKFNLKNSGGECLLLHPSHELFTQRTVWIDGGDIVQPIHTCLLRYSELILEKQCDGMIDWQRGLTLLADKFMTERLLYWIDDHGNIKTSPFERLKLLKQLRESDSYTSLSRFDNCDVPKSVYKLWLDYPDARWVLHWDNIFSAIEFAAMEIVHTVSRDGKWFDDVTEHQLTADALLKSAKRKGRLNKSTQPDGRKWLHSVYEVMEVYPAHAQSIRNALSKEI